MASEVVPLGVTVVIDPPLSTETNGSAEDAVEVDEVKVIAGEGVLELVDSVEDVCGATTISCMEMKIYLYLRMSRLSRKKFLVEALERHHLLRQSMRHRGRGKQLDNAFREGIRQGERK